MPRVLALSRRFGRDFPLLIMTSPATHDETLAFFETQSWFGLLKSAVVFFQQGTMPAVDLATGKVLLEELGPAFPRPQRPRRHADRTGRSWPPRRTGRRAAATIYYFQVDNPIVKLNDFVFVGRHLAARAEVSTKVVAAVSDREARQPGPRRRLLRHHRILGSAARAAWPPTSRAKLEAVGRQSRDPPLRPRLSNGSSAERIGFPAEHREEEGAASGEPGVDEGERSQVRAVHLDVAARRSLDRDSDDVRLEEFELLKNAEGRIAGHRSAAIIEQAGRWLESAGAKIPRNAEGKVAVPIEISPLAKRARGGRLSPARSPRETRFDQPTFSPSARRRTSLLTRPPLERTMSRVGLSEDGSGDPSYRQTPRIAAVQRAACGATRPPGATGCMITTRGRSPVA